MYFAVCESHKPRLASLYWQGSDVIPHKPTGWHHYLLHKLTDPPGLRGRYLQTGPATGGHSFLTGHHFLLNTLTNCLQIWPVLPWLSQSLPSWWLSPSQPPHSSAGLDLENKVHPGPVLGVHKRWMLYWMQKIGIPLCIVRTGVNGPQQGAVSTPLPRWAQDNHPYRSGGKEVQLGCNPSH